MRKGSGGRVAEEGSSLGLEPTESLPGPNYELQLETVQSNHIKNSPTPYFSINSINFSSSFEFHRPFFKLKCNLLRYLKVTRKQRHTSDTKMAPTAVSALWQLLRSDTRSTGDKRKTGALGFIRADFRAPRVPAKDVERQLPAWESILANHVSGKGLVSAVYKEL